MSTAQVGTTLYLANATPATFDKAGYEALTWVKVSGIGNAGAPQFTHNLIDVPDLESGLLRAIKGMKQGQDIEIDYREIAGDAGQALVATLDAAVTECSFKWVWPAALAKATVSSGLVHSFMLNNFDGESYAGGKFSIRPNVKHLTYTIP